MNTSTPGAPTFSSRPSDDEIRRARVFAEPLLPTGEKTDEHEQETAELAGAITTYIRRADSEDVSPLTRFLGARPSSAWDGSLLLNLGLLYRRAGYVSRALDAWERAWERLRGERGEGGKALADLALGELCELYARLGRRDRLEELLATIGDREITGPATEKIAGAREGAWLMNHQPGDAFRCGPCALDRVLAALRPGEAPHEIIRRARSSEAGTSLAEVAALATEVGLSMVMVKREGTAPIPVPAVVHWTAGHFAALVTAEQIGGELHYLSQDPTFGHDHWISQAAVDGEASGYFLVPGDAAPAGFRVASADEARSVWGRGNATLADPDPTWCDAPKAKEGCGSGAGLPMAEYNVHAMLVSLNIVDTPVGHAPPVGPPVYFTVTYNQREAFQPAVFSFSNLGPKWTLDWLSYVTDDPRNPSQTVTVYRSGGGREVFPGYDAATHQYDTHYNSRAILVRTSPTSYERRLPSGAKQVFALPDGATVAPRHVFMTQLVDPQGNAVMIGYDANHRVVSLTDALGRVTKIEYELANDPLKITRVTDPFGRSATFEYAGGRLVKIVDVIGIASGFSYAGDFVTSLTTPYGKTTFAFGESGPTRWLDATDPLGDTERVEFRNTAPGIPYSDPSNTVPAGVPLYNQYMNYRNTFYWDKEAWHDFPGDYTKARLTQWLHTQQWDWNVRSTAKESEKAPLENRVWYSYAGQPSVVMIGSTTRPGTAARVLDDGTTQVVRREYNDLGKVTRAVDPFHRETIYVYADNQIDLVEVRQKTGTTYEVLASFTYDDRHLPVAVTNAAGQVATYAYDARGQILAVTNAKNETTTFEHDPIGRLVKVIGPGAGAVTTYEYDALDRVRAVTDPDGYTISTEYDALDRPTKISYPDGSSSLIVYDRLDTAQRIDRLGRTTTSAYDALRQLTSVQDPAGRQIQLEWCKCGGLVGLTDPLGQKTTWKRDLNRRVIAKVLADGAQTRYVYERTTSRLKQTIDAKGQTTSYDYYIDDLRKQVSFANAQVPTPSVSFTYDPNHPRVTTMSDGAGVTRYLYGSAGAPGAQRLVSVDEPRSPGVRGSIEYGYDELGRLARRVLDGAATEVEYDASGRRVVERNALGTFTYSYVGASRRVGKVSYPNQQSTAYAYLDAAGDLRLREIANLDPQGDVLSRFGYEYDKNGKIVRWERFLPGSQPANSAYAFTYDLAGQLTGAALEADHAKVSGYAYEYDAAGNRTRAEDDRAATISIYNAVNELVAQHEAGPPAKASAFAYDANGNTISDGQRTFEWDAADRLTAVVDGSRRSEFSYDGLGRRVQIVERRSGKVEGTTYLGWCDDEICVEYEQGGQLANKPLLARQIFRRGFLESDGPTARFVARDHLGSIREVTDQGGKVVGRYDYDPYGVATRVHGEGETTFGYAGYYWHEPTGLNLTWYRAYAPALGRWLSRDPIGFFGGDTNLYQYVLAHPINARDPSGLFTFFDPGTDTVVDIFVVNNQGIGSTQHVRRCSSDEKNEISAAVFLATALVAACPGIEDGARQLWLRSLMNDMYACGGDGRIDPYTTCANTVTPRRWPWDPNPLPAYITIYDQNLGGALCTKWKFSLVTTVAHEAVHSSQGLAASHISDFSPADSWANFCTIFVPLINQH